MSKRQDKPPLKEPPSPNGIFRRGNEKSLRVWASEWAVMEMTEHIEREAAICVANYAQDESPYEVVRKDCQRREDGLRRGVSDEKSV